MRLNKQQIEEIRKISSEGKTNKEVANIFNVSEETIRYHLDEKLRKKKNELERKRYSKMSKKQKQINLEKHRGYLREYMRNRYHNDEEFRKKHIERVKQSKRKK
jgi:transposase